MRKKSNEIAKKEINETLPRDVLSTNKEALDVLSQK